MTPGRGYVRDGHAGLEQVRLNRSDLPRDVGEAYRVLATLTADDGERWVAWKLGGTNEASRAAFGIHQLCYGAIARDELLDRPRLVPALPLPELKGEVEIALRVGSDGSGYDAWAVAIEMPASPIANLTELGVVALVADRCAAGCLVLGPTRTGPLPGNGTVFGQEIDGVVAGEGRLSVLSAPPAVLLEEFLAMARMHGAPVKAGDWVATGGLTPCISYRGGQRVTASVDGAVVIDVIVGEAVT